jgi:hypothetical protein
MSTAGKPPWPDRESEPDRLTGDLLGLLRRLDALGVSGGAAGDGVPTLPRSAEAQFQDHLAMGVRAAEHFWDAGAPDRRVYGVRALRELRAAVAVLQEWRGGE